MIRVTCLTLLLLTTCASLAGAAVTTPERATELALDLVHDVAAYSLERREAPGAFAPWVDSEPRAVGCVLVHSYPELEPILYYVCLSGGEPTFVVIDAADGGWHAYGRAPQTGQHQHVSRARVHALAQTRFDPHCDTSDLRVIIGADRRLYWHAGIPGRAELFVSLTDPSDIRLGADGIVPPKAGEASRLRDPGQDARRAASDRYPSNYYIPDVPHYYQSWSNNCGPTAIEMVFDFWGPHVPQLDVTHVANNPPNGVDAGATTSDMRRAVHFSSISNAVQDSTLWGYDERALGYAAAENDWHESAQYPDRYDDLKRLVSSDIPVFIKTRFAEGHTAWHARVVRGYDDAMDVFIVHDPWYSLPYSGPDVHFNQSFLVDELWPYGGAMWGLFIAPWEVRVCSPPEVAPGEDFAIGAAVVYSGPDPFVGSFLLADAEATLTLPPDLEFAPGETATKPLNRATTTGTAAAASWQVIAGTELQASTVSVLARGLVTGNATSYGAYADSIGASGNLIVSTVSDPAPHTRIAVDQGGEGDYTTVQEGLCAASPGDTVVVAPGEYVGSLNRNLDFMGKDVLLTAPGGRTSTVIDCEGIAPALRFDGGETPATVVQGLTIRDGAAIGNYGGGIVCANGSSPMITSCTIDSCDGGFLGGGIYCEGSSSPILDHLIVRDCSAIVGSGLYCKDNSDPAVAFSTFHANLNSQVAANNAAPTVANTIIAGSPNGPAILCQNGAVPSVVHCSSYGNASGDSLCGSYHDNLFEDPLFCDAGGGSLTLHDDSPCLPTGNPWGEAIGALGAGDCGPSTGTPPGGPERLTLHPASPNPFRGSTAIEFTVPHPGAHVEIVVYNLAGQRIATLIDGSLPPGSTRLTWNGRDERGRRIASGVYFCVARAGGDRSERKILLLR